MIQKHRISTNIGKDQLVTVEINQDFDLLEILSLKFSQTDVYTNLCADYGVVCGRVIVNNGFGIPNAKISIFVPLSDIDEDDPVISALYPYKSVSDRNDNGYKYNLLPARKQHGGHEPTGTFPDQLDILSRTEVLEVYEKYYKYTVKTNESGDFMIWGAPLGQHTIHVDVDLSDIGCFSLRPDDFIRLGRGVDEFKNTYKFKASSDLGTLPQVVSFDKTIEIFPFWGNVDLCQIGITRTDFDLSDQGVRIEPSAYIIGGSFSDTGKNTINKNCKPRAKMGRKCQMTSEKGLIETIRFTHLKDTNHRPVLELMDLQEDIDDTGSFIMNIKMNMDFLYTNEFGENEYGNDPNKGIPTSAVHRFRFSIKNEHLGRVRTTANYLIPNIKEYYGDEDKSYAWSTNYDDYPAAAQSDILNNIDTFWYPQDYFYRFTYTKVYTVSSFQDGYSDVSTIYNGTLFKDRFIGIKDISPSEEDDCDGSANTFPVNYAVKNYSFKLLLADILLILEWFLDTVKLVFLNTIVRALITIGCAIDHRPLRSFAKKVKLLGFSLEESSQKKLPLVIYPECDECSGGEVGIQPPDNIGEGAGLPQPFCSVGSFLLNNPNRVSEGYLEIPYSSFTFTTDPSPGCVNCNSPESQYKNVVTLQQSSPYYLSGYTAVAQLIQNQWPYGFVDKSNRSTSGFFKDYLFYIGTTDPITSHPIYWKSYTYNIHDYFITGQTSFDIVYDGVTHPISFTIFDTFSLETELHNTFDIICGQGGGATITVDSSFGGSGNFTISPNNTKLFSILTIDGDTIAPSIFENTSVIIDYTGITFFDRDSEFNDPLPGYPSTPTGFTCDILLVFSDSSQTGTTSCLQEYPKLGITGQIENGCNLYDVPYDESLVSRYYTSSGSTTDMCVDDRLYVSPSGYSPGSNVESTVISELGDTRYCTSSKRGTPDLLFFKIGGGRVYPLPCEWAGESHKKITKSGLSEFSNGVYFIVPGSLTNGRLISILKEYRKRKRVGKLFCGGIVNYVFTNNWLSGALYFFAFKAKNKRRNNSKHCYSVVRWVKSQSKHYYRSCVYKSISGEWGENAVQLGNKKINRPTTFVDLGPRDEFIKEICTDAGLDPNCSISRLIGPTSFKSFGELQGLNINYRLDVTNNNFSIGDFFKNTSSPFENTFNGDVLQLISTNCEAGIEEFDLQNPKYLGYSYQWLDPEVYPNVFGNGGWYPTISNRFPAGKPNGPLPITFDFAENGERIRSCLNEPTHLDYSGNTVQGRLTESSQPVPFFLWDKKSRGFGGTVSTNPFNQNWDYSTVTVQPLQGMTYGYGISGSPNDASDKYLLLPITYTFTGNTITTTQNFTNELPFDIVNFTDNGIGGNSAPDDYYLYDAEYPGFTYLYVSSGYTVNNGGLEEIEAQLGTLYTRYGSAGTWNTQSWNYLDDIFIRRTEDYYSGSKQILSTPFLFYFGLRPGSTGLDKFIERFGPTGVFPSAE
jgi:hypothetical protein